MAPAIVLSQSEDLTQCSNSSSHQLWPRYQQQHHCQRACLKCRISGLIESESTFEQDSQMIPLHLKVSEAWL